MDASNPTIEIENSKTTEDDPRSLLASLSWSQIAARARIEADGMATEEEVHELASDPIRWRNVLIDMIEEVEDQIQSIR